MMRSFLKKCGAYALGAACLAGAAQAQDYRYPSTLPGYAAPQSYAAPRLADYRSVMAPSTAEGPNLVSPMPYGETIMPGIATPQGETYYGDGAVYGHDGVMPEADDSVMYNGAGCGGRFLGGLCGLSNHQSCWFGGARGLVMTLQSQDFHWLSYDDINLDQQILHHENADMNWSGGVEARIGRYFNCGQNAVELVYWGIYPGAAQANRTTADVDGTLNHVFTFNSLSYDGGAGGGVEAVDDWFNFAERHRVQRDWAFNNVEVNLLSFRNSFMGGCGANGLGCGPAVPAGCWDPCMPRLNLSWLAGFRFFRFDESFQFASDRDNVTFDNDDGELYYDIDVDNELYGFQLGGDLEMYLTRRLSVSAGTRFGVFENYMEQRQRIGGSNGAAFVNDPVSPNFGREYDFTSRKHDIAFISQLDGGVNFYLTNNLRATGGYRVLAANGVARTTDQIPYNFDDILGAADINHRGCMVLHGAYAGLEFNY